MKISRVLALCVCGSSVFGQMMPGGALAAQTAPADPVAQAEKEVDKAKPPIPQGTIIKLQAAQLEQAKLVIELKDVIAKYGQLQGSLNAQAKVLNDLKAAALKDAELDPEKWDVDLDRMAFVAKPEKPAAAKPPAKPASAPGKPQ